VEQFVNLVMSGSTALYKNYIEETKS